jgi:hypothetical protein
MSSETHKTLFQKLLRPEGLATSVHRTDLENVMVIECVLFAYKNNLSIQYASRLNNDWTTLADCPTDFNSTRYRFTE